MKNGGGVNLQEVLKRAVKYLIEGAAVAAAAFYLPQKKMGVEEVAMIAFTAAATFAVLDMFAPSVGSAESYVVITSAAVRPKPFSVGVENLVHPSVITSTDIPSRFDTGT